MVRFSRILLYSSGLIVYVGRSPPYLLGMGFVDVLYWDWVSMLMLMLLELIIYFVFVFRMLFIAFYFIFSYT